MAIETIVFDVVWVESGTGGTRVLLRSGDFMGATPSPPVLLHASTAPLAAAALGPLENEKPAAVHLLLGPTGTLGQMVYERLPLRPDAEKLPEPLSFAPPAEPVIAWAIADSNALGLPVAALACDEVVWRDAAGTQPYRVLVAGVPAPGHISLQTLRRGAVWLQWHDPAHGVLLKPLSPDERSSPGSLE